MLSSDPKFMKCYPLTNKPKEHSDIISQTYWF